MIRDTETSGVIVVSHPMLRLLVSFPIACFCGALATDIAYAVTTDMMWADFSAWLLAVGMAMGVLAAIAGLVAIIGRRRWPGVQRPVWPVALGGLVVLVLGGLDNLVHSRDAWTSVVPMGLVLSVLTVLVLLATIWLGAASPVLRGTTVQYQGARR